MAVHYFFECLMCVTYINSVTHRALYLIDNTFRLAFTFINTFSVDFGCKRTVTFSIHYVFENIPRPIFAARSLLRSSAKLLNLWKDILTFSQERLKIFLVR